MAKLCPAYVEYVRERPKKFPRQVWRWQVWRSAKVWRFGEDGMREQPDFMLPGDTLTVYRGRNGTGCLHIDHVASVPVSDPFILSTADIVAASLLGDVVQIYSSSSQRLP